MFTWSQTDPVQLYCNLLSDFGAIKKNEFGTILLIAQTLSVYNFALFVMLI